MSTLKTINKQKSIDALNLIVFQSCNRYEFVNAYKEIEEKEFSE